MVIKLFLTKYKCTRTKRMGYRRQEKQSFRKWEAERGQVVNETGHLRKLSPKLVYNHLSNMEACSMGAIDTSYWE
jgi:hypothetical protein